MNFSTLFYASHNYKFRINISSLILMASPTLFLHRQLTSGYNFYLKIRKTNFLPDLRSSDLSFSPFQSIMSFFTYTYSFHVPAKYATKVHYKKLTVWDLFTTIISKSFLIYLHSYNLNVFSIKIWSEQSLLFLENILNQAHFSKAQSLSHPEMSFFSSCLFILCPHIKGWRSLILCQLLQSIYSCAFS